MTWIMLASRRWPGKEFAPNLVRRPPRRDQGHQRGQARGGRHGRVGWALQLAGASATIHPPSVSRFLAITANILGAAVLLALALNPQRPLMPVFAMLVVAVACGIVASVRWR